jgi:hypothetical protein
MLAIASLESHIKTVVRKKSEQILAQVDYALPSLLFQKVIEALKKYPNIKLIQENELYCFECDSIPTEKLIELNNIYTQVQNLEKKLNNKNVSFIFNDNNLLDHVSLE